MATSAPAGALPARWCFGSSSMRIWIRILVSTFLHLDPDPGGWDPNKDLQNLLSYVSLFKTIFCNITFKA